MILSFSSVFSSCIDFYESTATFISDLNIATRSIDEIEQRATSAIDIGGTHAPTINSKFNFIVFNASSWGRSTV